MKLLVVTLLAVVALVNCKGIDIEDVIDYEAYTSYEYHIRTGIPLADEIREFEAKPESRIVEGSASNLGQFPYQAGLVIDTPRGQSVCGGSILGARRVLTAAHCYWDGNTQASRFTVVLGSIRLFSGGQRLTTTNVVMHCSWNPTNFRDDIAMITVNSNINFSNNVAAITLPSGAQLNENFVGVTATASGFGRTSDAASGGISSAQALRHVNLTVISNADCARSFKIVVSTHICTSGAGGRGTCGGDSGGPLAINRNGRPLLIGVTTFGASGCTHGFPAAFVRVTSYNSWIRNHL